MAKAEICFDFNDGDFFVRPETLRRIADELEATGSSKAVVMEFASDQFEADFKVGSDDLFMDYEEEESDEPSDLETDGG